LSKGRASFSMEPECFEEVPPNVVNSILETSTRGRY
jgi:translation elongation factor EF-G